MGVTEEYAKYSCLLLIMKGSLLMDNKWSEWKYIPSRPRPRGKYPRLYEHAYGIYQIRAADVAGKPIPIPRMGSVDEEGILYIGRSGYKDRSPSRTLAVRLKEFEQVDHSGAQTYFLAECTGCLNQGIYKKHKLQCRVMYLSGDKEEIDKKEIGAIGQYFCRFGELPPCNSSFPGKFSYFLEIFKNAKILSN